MDPLLKQNAISLTILQIGQYLVPLIVLPYLTRVLGVDGFGQIGFAAAFTMYFVLVVEWGFNLSATRDVSVQRDDKNARSVVFWETLLARVILNIGALVIIWILVSQVARLEELSTLIRLGMLQVLATTLSTAFYYQGIEKMSAMAFINLGIRTLSIPLIFFFVSSPDQVELAFGIQTGCFLIASLVNLFLLLRSDEISWVTPSFRGSWRRLIGASPLFFSNAGTSLYTNTNVIVLGFVTSEANVGYFVAGFTLVKAVVGLSGPFAQAVFPRASLVLNQGAEASVNFLRNMFRLQGLLGLSLSLVLFLFLPWGVTWFYGEAFQHSVEVVAWLALLPFLVCLASGLGLQTLVTMGHHRWYSGVLITGGVFNCLLLFLMGSIWGATGAAVAVLITECAIMVGMAVGVKKYAPLIWRELVCFSKATH